MWSIQISLSNTKVTPKLAKVQWTFSNIDEDLVDLRRYWQKLSGLSAIGESAESVLPKV
jgi:hypothetical protein